MYRWLENLMFSNSGNDASSFLVLKESSSLFARVWSFCPSFMWARLTFSCRFTWEFSTSKFEPECHQFPEARPTLFVSSSFAELTRDRDLCGETSSWHWPCITRLVGLAFATGEPSLEVVSCPRFDMAPFAMRSPAWERKLSKCRKAHNIKRTQKVIPLISRETSFGQNVSMLFFWCQHIWFGSWVPSWFCQTTNQEQLCEFSTHVSLWDFVLWLSFWSQLHCLQKCKAETLPEKNVCWWVRDPLYSIDQLSIFLWHVGSWFWNQELHQLPGGQYVWLEFCLWLNVNFNHDVPKIKSR